MYLSNSYYSRVQTITIVVISCLISAWLIHDDPLINRDGITYLRTAQSYLDDGLIAALKQYDRPFLSIVFAEIHRFTGLSLVTSAHLVITFLYAILCLGFVSAVRILGGGRSTQIIAALVILSHPVIGNYREDIMRDPGYWAMGILAFRQLLLFLRSPSWHHYPIWFAYIVAAVLFRFEAVVYLCASPVLIALVCPSQKRLAVLAGFGLPPVICILSALAYALLTHDTQYLAPVLFTDMGGYVSKGFTLSEFFQGNDADSRQNWIGEYSRDDISIFLLSGLSGLLLINTIRSLTWPWFLYLLWGRDGVTPDTANDQQRRLLNAHILLTMSYLALFLLVNRFMLERYVGFLSLLILLCIPTIIERVWNKQKAFSIILTATVFLGLSADTLHNGNAEKAYVRDATQWMRNELPHEATLITNYSYIAYFSGLEYRWTVNAYKFSVHDLREKKFDWMTADYMAVTVKESERGTLFEFLEQNSLSTLRVFEGGRHGNIHIVKINHEAK